MSTSLPDSPQPQTAGRGLRDAGIVIIVGVLATTLAQPQVLAKLPLQNLLKNDLHATMEQNANFFFWAGLAWYFKPLAGIFTDAFPILGTRRRAYILISATLAVLTWLSLIFTPEDYTVLLAINILLNLFMVISSTVVGGFMVETAQKMQGSGRLTSLRQFVQQACYLIVGPFAGYLASVPFGWTAGLCGAIVGLLVPATYFFLHEEAQTVDSGQLLAAAKLQLKRILQARMMWGAAALSALFYLAPGLSTALFYRQQDVLKMSTDVQGWLILAGGVSGMAAAALYAVLCRKYSLRILMYACLFAGGGANIAYLWYSSVPNAVVIDTLNGFGYSMAELALMDLAIRATPAGSEGLGFSLMMSVRNLCLFGTDKIGASLIENYGFEFNTLVILNTLTTLCTLPFVYFLPAALVANKDEAAPASASST